MTTLKKKVLINGELILANDKRAVFGDNGDIKYNSSSSRLEINYNSNTIIELNATDINLNQDVTIPNNKAYKISGKGEFNYDSGFDAIQLVNNSVGAGWDVGVGSDVVDAFAGNNAFTINSTLTLFNGASTTADIVFQGSGDAQLLFVDAGANKIGIGDATPAEKLDVNGNVRADGYIEYSPAFEGDGVQAIKDIASVAGSQQPDGWAEVDHDTLPEGVMKITTEKRYKNKQTDEIVKGDAIVQEIKTKFDEKVSTKGLRKALKEVEKMRDDVLEKYEIFTVDVKGRNMGKMVQVMLKAIKQLTERIEALEGA